MPNVEDRIASVKLSVFMFEDQPSIHLIMGNALAGTANNDTRLLHSPLPLFGRLEEAKAVLWVKDCHVCTRIDQE